MTTATSRTELAAPAAGLAELSLSDIFPVVLPRLPRRAAIQADRWSLLARACPLGVFGCFELGLGGHEIPLFDFSIRLKNPAEASGLEQAGLVSPHLARLLSSWRASTEEQDPITSLWAEYDLDRWTAGPPPPIFFTQFASHLSSERILSEFFPLLFDRPLGVLRRQRMEAVFRELPPHARILYVSSLEGRGVEGARFELIDLPLEEVAGYLAKLGAGDWRSQVEAAAPFHRGNDQFHLSFDMTDRLEPRLGFQSGFLKQPPREPRWAEYFGRLEQAGLCTAEESRLMLAWPGVDTAGTAPDAWPNAVGPEAAGLPLRGCCFRAISHLKVLTWPDRPPQAKAYLLFGYMPPRPASG